jgi:Gram-negative bacterial TonB protein C-terminal
MIHSLFLFLLKIYTTNKAMKQLTGVLIFLLSFIFGATSQEVPEADTTIYSVVEEMPRFPGCEAMDTTIQVKTQCAQASLLSFFYDNISYPLEARQNGNEGMVVLTFVVEKDGTIHNPTILKDIGGGCGE